MVNGLAWTEYGGEVLHTEAATMPGKGKLIVTGLLARRDEGVGAGGGDLRALAGRRASASRTRSSRRTTFTSTSPGLTPRTARRPA